MQEPEPIILQPDAPLLSRREKRKQAIRERIEDAAYALFKRQGIDGTSIEQICRQADVARRTFYGHYPNKQALLTSLSYQRIWGTADALVADVLARHDTAASRMVAMIDYMEDQLANYQDIDRALILVNPAQPGESNHLRDVSDSLQTHLCHFIRAGQDNGDATTDYSAELLAEMVMGTLNTILMTWANDPQYPLMDRLEQARRLFRSVLQPA